MNNPPGYQVSPAQARPRRRQSLSRLHPLEILRRVYWFLAFPLLLYMTYSSLTNMLFLDHIADNAANDQSFPHSSLKPHHPNLNHQQRYPGYSSGPGYSGLKGYSFKHNPFDNSHRNAESQWDESMRKASYPDFLIKLEKARMALKDVAINPATMTAAKNSSVASLWPLTKPPKDQPVNFTKPILPTPTNLFKNGSGNQNSSILILVLSEPDNFIKRQAIRETWANTNNVIFVVGQACCRNNPSLDNTTTTPTTANTTTGATSTANKKADGASSSYCSLQESLIREQFLYQDLLEIPVVDDYRLLPEKVVQTYQYVVSHSKLRHVQWLIKADDDMYVRPKTLERYLRKYNFNIPMIIGKIVPHSPVSRDGKWAEQYYLADYYPYWPQGSAGHVLSRKAAEYVATNSAKLHRFQGEDVSLGIWMNESKLPDLTYIQAKRMITNAGTQACGIPKYIMIGHGMNPEEVCHCHLRFRAKFNETKTSGDIVDNAWLDDPAEWKDQIASGTFWDGLGEYSY